jgi:hypothetical protein
MFSPGDRIECINEVSPLIRGKIYTIKSASSDYVYIMELDGGWSAARFTLKKWSRVFVLDEVE